MRITHQMLSRNYIGRMNTNLNNLTKSNDKMTTQRSFNKGYENVTDAGKALRLRKMIDNNERYQTTIRDAKARAEGAEDALRTVNSLMINAKDKLVEGMNGSMSLEDRQKIASELEAAQQEILQVMNTKVGDKYVFAAAGNSDGSAPFQVQGGALLYNGTPVDTMQKDPTTGQIQDASGNPVKYNAHNYVDIGFGYKLGADGRVDPNTAFKDTYSGVEGFGFGTVNGVPQNAFSLFGDMVTSLRNNDFEQMGKDLNAISTTMDYLLTSVTEIGARGVTLDNTLASLENEYINLAETQNKIEGIDLPEETIYNKDFEMSWLVTLQLGSKILPQTIFDFLR